MNNIYVTKATIPPIDEYYSEIKSIWDSHWLTNGGEKYWNLHSQLKEYMGVSQLELFTNGHMSIELSLQALELEGEVITTPFTFASTTHAIVRNGLTPIFCDINDKDYTMDVEQIESLINENTCAIMPVHVYGNICDVEEINNIARKHNLKVIYDAAHAFGEKKSGIGIGNFGDVSCFSFHATKVFNTIEGGAACYKDGLVGTKLAQLKNFGIKDEETVDGVGANAKMNEFQAAMGICNLRHINDSIESRKEVVERYKENLFGIRGVKICESQPDVESNYSYFPVIFEEDKFGENRNSVAKRLANNGVYARKYFYPMASEFDCYREKYDSNSTPIAKRISEQVLTLPVYPELDKREIDKICSLIKNRV